MGFIVPISMFNRFTRDYDIGIHNRMYCKYKTGMECLGLF